MAKRKQKYEAASDLVKRTFEKYAIGKKEQISKIDKYHRMWQGLPVDRRYTGGLANMVVNESHKAIETFVANLISLRNAANPAYNVVEREKIDNLPADPDRLKALQLCVDYQLDKCNFDYKLENVYRNLCIEGTAIFANVWDMTKVKYSSYQVEDKTEDVYKDEDMTYGVPNELAVPEKKIVGKELVPTDVEEVFDSANFVPKDLRNIYIDKTIEEFDKQPCVIELEKDVAWESLKLNSAYVNLDVLEEKIFAKKSEKEKEAGVTIDLVHYQGKYDLKKDGVAEEYEIICEKNTWTTILCRPNPYNHGTRAYRLVKFLPKKGSAYGMGICELMYRQQVELNDNRNQMSDNKTLQNACMFVANGITNVKKDQLRIRPFGIIDSGINGAGRLEPLKVNDFIKSAIILERSMKEDFQTTTGATLPIQGGGPGAQTLGQSELVLKQGMNKLITLLLRVERDLLQETYKMFYQLTLQYLETKWKIMIVGSDIPMEVDKLKIFADVTFEGCGAKYIQDSLLQRQQDQQLLNLISPLPRYVGVMDALIEDIFKASGRGYLIQKEMEKVKQNPQNPNAVAPEEGGGQNAQIAAGVTPQVGATPDLAALKRQVGTPQQNQYGG
jgi:hypothetical protein